MKLENLDLNKTYTYADYLTWAFDETVELILFPNLVIDLQDIFPTRDLVEEPWDEHYVRM